MSEQPTHIILFDGVCNLCNGFVNWLIHRDQEALFHFASLQSDIGKLLLQKYDLDTNQIDSVVYIRDDKAYIKSTAVLKISQDLGGAWKLVHAFIIVPSFVRDIFYDLVAWSRYALFGKRDSCVLPPPDFKSRFLE